VVNQPENPENFKKGLKTVIVVVKSGQSKDQAWRSHLRKNPADRNADIKIFDFAPQKAP
jgi:hypothetical protein